MYRILCLTIGDYIKINPDITWSIGRKMPTALRTSIHRNYLGEWQWGYLEFDTEYAAKWFIGHRLVYNPLRKDAFKLELMRQIFKINNIEGWQTAKLEFLVEEV